MKKLSLLILSIFTLTSLVIFTETTFAKSSGYRSSITGKYVSKGYATSHKSTTQSFKKH